MNLGVCPVPPHQVAYSRVHLAQITKQLNCVKLNILSGGDVDTEPVREVR